ncbi:redoxin domain-containing protein [Alicyclobacillus sp. ALC3]|uniref:redoxin domain-containing protein n=1 Tax=Alicyclobacillus sp. ALC3 TaxID=2796143 RepID=UPI0023789199|nr:redoxin domain-containing protein [Alicyclobacillus sp. ALC3]WDL98813.1 redoxin domain-containing protein [Alicyclobacillus sp. ALC3]
MRKGTGQLRQWIFATLAVVLVLGAGVGMWRLSTHLHVNPKYATPVQTNSISNIVAASVDPGTQLSGKVAPNFHLTDQFGNSGSLSSFRGKVVILSFIDSKCTTVCPLTAAVLQNVRYDLGKSASKVAFVAVNANQNATSVKDTYTWSKEHHVLHMWHYFTGSRSQLQKVWNAYYVQSVVLNGTNIQHTPAVYVIGPDGHERWIYLNSDQSSTPVIGTEVRMIMKQVVPLIPGHPNIAIPSVRKLAYLPGKFGPSGAAQRSFTLPDIQPGGTMSQITVGAGNKPTLLEFFATWCPDCEEEMPTLIQLQRWSQKHPGFAGVVGIDLRGSESSTEHVKSYAQKLRLPFPIALDSKDSVANMYGVNGIPTQALVSASGHIMWYHQGLIGFNQLKSQIEQHIGA